MLVSSKTLSKIDCSNISHVGLTETFHSFIFLFRLIVQAITSDLQIANELKVFTSLVITD